MAESGLKLKGGQNETQALHIGADHRDAERGGGGAFSGREGQAGLPGRQTTGVDDPAVADGPGAVLNLSRLASRAVSLSVGRRGRRSFKYTG